MTIPEAFKEAGHPIPENLILVFFTNDTFGTRGWVAYNEDEQYFWLTKGVRKERPSRKWKKQKFGYKRKDYPKERINLYNFPAEECIEALPRCVQKVVREKQWQSLILQHSAST